MTSSALFEMHPASSGPGPNRAALEQLLSELEEAGLLQGKALALGESLKSTADAVDRGMAASKVSIATTTLNKLLLEGIEQLPEPRRASTGDAYDVLTAVIEQMTTQALAGEVDDELPAY